MDLAAVNVYFSEKSKRQKIIRTIVLTLVWITMGIYMTIPGPTLIDLKLRLGVNYDEISDAVSGVDIGWILGSIIGGLFVDRYVRFCGLMLGMSLTVAAIAAVCAPYASTVRAIWVCMTLNGLSVGVNNVAGQKLMLMLWQEQSPSPLNILHSGFGIGAFLIPLIATPFLAVLQQSPALNISSQHQKLNNYYNFTSTTTSTAQTDTFHGTTTTEYTATMSPDLTQTNIVKESRIELAYLITAMITMVMSVVLYVYQVYDFREMRNRRNVKEHVDNNVLMSKNTKLRDLFNPASCADGNFLYGAAIFALLFLHYLNLCGGERLIVVFLRSFAVDHLGFSVDTGSYINTMYFASFSIGRFVGFFAARWIPVRILIVLDTGAIFISALLLNIFAVNNTLAFWILLQPLGLFIGPAFPVGVGWGNYHVVMSGMALCLTNVGSSLGGLAYIRIAGYLFAGVGPRTFLYQILGFGICALLFSIILDLIGSKHGSRFTRDLAKEHGTVLEVMGKGCQDIENSEKEL